jgi:hypothetical protein
MTPRSLAEICRHQVNMECTVAACRGQLKSLACRGVPESGPFDGIEWRFASEDCYAEPMARRSWDKKSNEWEERNKTQYFMYFTSTSTLLVVG